MSSQVAHEDTLFVNTALEIKDKSGIPVLLPDIGYTQVFFDTDSSKLAYVNSTGSITNLDMFGSNYEDLEIAGEISTTSLTPVNAISLEVKSFDAGTYRVGFYYTWYMESLDDSFIAEIDVDTTNIHTQFTKIVSSASNQFQNSYGFIILSLFGGDHIISINYYCTGSRAYIGERRLEFWRIS
jgi:hypothetical protein